MLLDVDEKYILDHVTEKKLRENLKETIKRSGVLDAVKAQIRHEFISGIGISKSPMHKCENNGFDVQERVTTSIIYHFMKHRSLSNSISVFVAECGLNVKSSILSEEDILKLLKFNALRSGTNENKNRNSVFDKLVVFSLSLNNDKLKDAETQTAITGPDVRESLDRQILNLRQTHLQFMQSEEKFPSKSIEERMISFQRECEQRMKRDLELQMENLKENLAMKVRLEESHKARLTMEGLRKELEADYSRRLQNHLDRDAENVKRLAEQERQMNKNMYDARQMMQREIDDLRTREQMGARKIELEGQGLKILEVRLKEAQSLIDGRERDLTSRERKLAEKEAAALDTARKEVREQARVELDQLFTERSAVAIERQKVQEERAAQVAAMVSASATHNQLKTALEELVRREEEVGGLRRTLERLHQNRAEEDANLSKMIVSVDPKFAEYPKNQQIIKLVQKNADLEVELASLHDAAALKAESNRKQKEINRLEEKLQSCNSKLETSNKMAKNEIEQLSAALNSEKAKVAAQTHKVKEFQRLLREKGDTIQSLQRQIEKPSKTVRTPIDNETEEGIAPFQVPNYNKNYFSSMRQRTGGIDSFDRVLRPNKSDFDIDSAAQVESFSDLIVKRIYSKLSDESALYQQMQRQYPMAPMYAPAPVGMYPQHLLPAPATQTVHPIHPPSLLLNANMGQYSVFTGSENKTSSVNVPDTSLSSSSTSKLAAMKTTNFHHAEQSNDANLHIFHSTQPFEQPVLETQSGIKQAVELNFVENNKKDNDEEAALQRKRAIEEEDKQQKLTEALMIQEKQHQIELFEKLRQQEDLLRHQEQQQQQQQEEELEQQKQQELEAKKKVEEELERSLRQLEEERFTESARKAAEEMQSQQAEAARQQQAKEEEEKALENERLERERIEEIERGRLQMEAVNQERKREEEERRVLLEAEEAEEKQRQLAAQRKEDDDAAAIQEARARVLARRKQKQLRDSGESLASDGVGVSVSTSISNLRAVNARNSESEVGLSLGFPPPTSSTSRSLDVAVSVSLASTSISKSATSSSAYRYRDSDRVGSDDENGLDEGAEETNNHRNNNNSNNSSDDDGGGGAYRPSTALDRGRSYGAASGRDRESHSHSATAAKNSDSSEEEDTQFEHGNNTMDDSEDQWS